MEGKTIGYILIGTAVVGITAAGITYIVKKQRDKKEAEKEAADKVAAAYSTPASLPQQQQQNATPKPTAPKPASVPSSASAPPEKDSTFYWNATLKSDNTYYLEIEWLQKYLNTKGYGLKVDGVFGRGTRAAMYKAMGLPNADSLTITLLEFFTKAEAAFRAPMLLSQKISASDFNNYINPPAPQNTNISLPYGTGTGYGTGIFPTVSGMGNSVFGLSGWGL